MTPERDTDLDAALARLARLEDAAAPAPRPELFERVLAGAADVGAGAARPAPPVRRPVPARRRAGWGWFGGAIAAMALSLSLGVGAGYAGVASGDMFPLMPAGKVAPGPPDTFGGEPF